jgi:hypothetical protein
VSSVVCVVCGWQQQQRAAAAAMAMGGDWEACTGRGLQLQPAQLWTPESRGVAGAALAASSGMPSWRRGRRGR